jgi:phospholipase/lecithinase/hemolysin
MAGLPWEKGGCMKRLLTGTVLVLFLVLPFSALGSTSFSTIVALGDSLTDNGSVTYGTNTNPVDFHGFDYYTDGAVWVETLAGAMGSGLWDVAYGGATTGYDNPAAGTDVTGLQWQVDYAIPSGIEVNDTLFTVWAGANDFFQGGDFSAAAANIGTALDNLATLGATSILVPNLPDLGLTPGFYGGATSALATGWTQAYNQQLAGVLQAFANDNSSVDLYFLDIYSIFTDLILDGNGDINPIYWSELFWDEVHPTSFGHTIVAAEAYAVLQADPLTPVPLPAAAWLLGTGLIGLIGIRRKMDR